MTATDPRVNPWVAALLRIAAILFGVFYLVGIGFVLSLVIDTDPAVCQLMTAAAAILIMFVLTVFGERVLARRQEGIRFSISSLMLVVVPLAIYLAAARLVIRAAFRSGPPEVWVMIIFGAFLAFVMVLTTVVLLYLAEAIVWFLVHWQRRAQRRDSLEIGPTERADLQPKKPSVSRRAGNSHKGWGER